MACQLLGARPEVTFVSYKLIQIAALMAFACGAVATRPAVAEAVADPDSSRVAQTMPASEESIGRVLELERVVVTGNSHVSDSAILNTLQLAARDTLNATILEEARLRLLSEHPLLSTVDFATQPGSQRGLVILNIAVTERRPIVVVTGYGHHDTYGWFLTLLGLRVDPAAAHGTEFGLGLRLGFHIAGLDGEFEKRGKSGGFGWGGSFHIYSQEQIFFAGEEGPATGDTAAAGKYAREFRQKIERAGAELRLLYTLGNSTQFTFGLQAETARPDSSYKEPESGDEFVFSEFPRSLQPDIKHTDITGLFFRVVRDTRDGPDYPQSGSYAILQMQSNSSTLGGDVTFTKAEGDIRKHIRVGDRRVISSRLAAGIVSRGTPYYERFYVGGMYSVRGFRGLSLSPPSGNWAFTTPRP